MVTTPFCQTRCDGAEPRGYQGNVCRTWKEARDVQRCRRKLEYVSRPSFCCSHWPLATVETVCLNYIDKHSSKEQLVAVLLPDSRRRRWASGFVEPLFELPACWLLPHRKRTGSPRFSNDTCWWPRTSSFNALSCNTRKPFQLTLGCFSSWFTVSSSFKGL